MHVIDRTPRPQHTTTTTAHRTPANVSAGAIEYGVTHTWACTCGATGAGPHGAFQHAWGGSLAPVDALAHAEVVSVVR